MCVSQRWDVRSWQRNISISSLRELKSNGFSFQKKTTVLHLLGTKGGKGMKGLGVGVASGVNCGFHQDAAQADIVRGR